MDLTSAGKILERWFEQPPKEDVPTRLWRRGRPRRPKKDYTTGERPIICVVTGSGARRRYYGDLIVYTFECLVLAERGRETAFIPWGEIEAIRVVHDLPEAMLEVFRGIQNAVMTVLPKKDDSPDLRAEILAALARLLEDHLAEIRGSTLQADYARRLVAWMLTVLCFGDSVKPLEDDESHSFILKMPAEALMRVSDRTVRESLECRSVIERVKWLISGPDEDGARKSLQAILDCC